MATTTVSSPAILKRAFLRPLSSLATAGLLAFAGLLITANFPAATPLSAMVALGILGITGWMLVSERYEWSLAILMLYIGLADGYLKLSTGSSQVTLVRDLLLYAIAGGALIRIAVRKEMLTWPPLTGWVIAWVLVVGVQIANPSNGTLLHSAASVRPHAEWVPLFFLGYIAVRSQLRLRNFLLLLLVVAAANGVVGLIQSNLSPEELSNWGPGYKSAINGEDGVSARTFSDSTGTERNRPFALGGDFGFGGIVGLIAIPAALALLGLARRPGIRVVTALLAVGTVVAVVTSEARVAVIGAVIAAFAFAMLTVTSRAGLRTVLALGLTIIVSYATVGILASGEGEGKFDRYETISNPTEAVGTALDYRRDTVAKIPEYAADFPLGAGFGQAGPAASVSGGNSRGLDAESEPTFLLIELGLPGLIVMLGFNLVLCCLSIVRIRRIEDRETRILLTGVAAPLFAILSTWWVGVATTSTPSAPYLWFAAGVLAYWLLGEGQMSLRSDGLRASGAHRVDEGQARWSTG